MISFLYRFHGHNSLRYVYKNGQAVRSHLITVKYTANPHRNNSRFSVIISKKVLKSAVGRNRVRRRLYEVIRKEIPKMNGVYDVAVLVFSSEIISLPQDELVKLIHEVFSSANLYR